MRSCQPVELRSSNVKHGAHTRPRKLYGCSTARPFVRPISRRLQTPRLSQRRMSPRACYRSKSCSNSMVVSLHVRRWILGFSTAPSKTIGESASHVSELYILRQFRSFLLSCCYFSAWRHSSKLAFFIDSDAIHSSSVLCLCEERESMKKAAAKVSDGAEEAKKRVFFLFLLSQFFFHLFYLFYQFDKNYATDPPRVWIYAENEDHKRSVMMVEKGNISLVCRSDARPKVTSHSWFKNVSWHSRAAALSAIKRWKIWLLFCVCAEKAPSKSFARYSLLPWVSPLMSVWEVGGKHEKKCTRWWKNPFSCCMLFCSHIVYIAWWHSALDENIQHKFMFLRMIHQHGTFPLMHSFSSTRLFLMRCREHTKISRASE